MQPVTVRVFDLESAMVEVWSALVSLLALEVLAAAWTAVENAKANAKAKYNMLLRIFAPPLILWLENQLWEVAFPVCDASRRQIAACKKNPGAGPRHGSWWTDKR